MKYIFLASVILLAASTIGLGPVVGAVMVGIGLVKIVGGFNDYNSDES